MPTSHTRRIVAARAAVRPHSPRSPAPCAPRPAPRVLGRAVQASRVGASPVSPTHAAFAASTENSKRCLPPPPPSLLSPPTTRATGRAGKNKSPNRGSDKEGNGAEEEMVEVGRRGGGQATRAPREVGLVVRTRRHQTIARRGGDGSASVGRDAGGQDSSDSEPPGRGRLRKGTTGGGGGVVGAVVPQPSRPTHTRRGGRSRGTRQRLAAQSAASRGERRDHPHPMASGGDSRSESLRPA